MKNGKYEYDFESQVEKILREDCDKIEVDLKFKRELKNKILNGQIEEDFKSLGRRTNSNSKIYLKIASSFAICVLIGGSLYHLPGKAKESNDITIPESDLKNPTIAEVTKLKEVSINNFHNIKNSQFGNEDFQAEDVSNVEENKKLDNKNEMNNSKTEKDEQVEVKNDIKDSSEGVEVSKKEEQSSKVNEGAPTLSDMKENSGETVNSENNISDDEILLSKEEINDLLEGTKQEMAGTTTEKPQGPVITMPSVKDEIKDKNDEIQIYDSSISKDGTISINAEENKIYIVKEGNTEVLLETDSEAVIKNPNLMDNGNVIYAKSYLENEEEKSYIYMYDNENKEEVKLFEGKEPMLSNDNEKIAYEFKGEILIANLNNNVIDIVDKGYYPSWSHNGKYLSYVKEEVEYSKEENSEGKIEKICSTIWIYNLENGDRYPITNKEFITDNEKIDKWAQVVRDDNVDIRYSVIPKYTYYESIWSIDNNKIYAIRRDNDKEVYDLVQFTLN